MENVWFMTSSFTLYPQGRECPTTRHNITTTPRGMMGRSTSPWQQVGLVRPSLWTGPYGPPPLPSPRQPPGSTHWAATSHITTISLARLARPIRTLLGLSLSKKLGNAHEQRQHKMIHIKPNANPDTSYIYTHAVSIFDL